MSKIKVMSNHVLIKTDEVKAGDMDVFVPTAIEVGFVEQIGEGWDFKQDPLKVGDKIHFKSWGVDIITDGKKKYLYLCQDTKAIKAVIK